jgi:2,3-bisphosphoglycerate-dependent phosphoglycerate mutase
MQLYFIRHGQSENNLLWQRTGSSAGRSQDPELTEVGRQQTEILARFLSQTGSDVATQHFDPQNVAGFGITHLYSSLMVRAVATGTAIARALDLPLVAWEQVHEAGGIYHKDVQTGERIGQPGYNRAYFETHYPHLVLSRSLDQRGWWDRPYEEPEQRRERAQCFLFELLDRHGASEDRVAVVSHGGFFNYFVRVLFKLPPENEHWFIMNNAAITRIDFHPDRVEVVYVNRVDFLPSELVT